MYIFKLKLSEKARGYCMYVFIVYERLDGIGPRTRQLLN